MKVSLNTVKYLSNVPVDDDIDSLVKKIGAQLGAVEEVVDYRPRYAGIVVAKVVSCVKHPNADKLHVCHIDDGGSTPDVNRDENGNVQVVCGAPNVREGLTVAWIPPGATVPVTYETDPFVLEARELRGVVSNGMLASASELGISNDHSGLLEINSKDVGENNITPGTPFVRLYGLDDVIIDIENKMFTHRPDCFGVMGVAREIAGIYGQEFESPDWYWKIPRLESAEGLELHIENRLPKLVPRFMAVAVDNVSITPSPIWMQALLTRVGIKPINNIVDLTNYYSYLTAQPLHAYDYDKVAERTNASGATLVVRHPEEGEEVLLLNGKTIQPRSEAIMIASDKELIGVGGVMGGTTTEVDEQTKRIILECATFDMYSIRKTSMAHGLFTDAVTRFNKGQSPLQNNRVISEVVRQISSLAGGKQASDFFDDFVYPDEHFETNQIVHAPVTTTADFVNKRLGSQLSADEIKTTLRNVNFACPDLENSDAFEVYAPFFRTDIVLPEDVVEEVGRLRGFDSLPFELPGRKMVPAEIAPNITLQTAFRSKLAALGANEVLTYSFVHGDLIRKVGQSKELAFRLTNALSPDLQYYRLSLTPSLLAHVHPNSKSGYEEFAIYEIGKVHNKSALDTGGLPLEFSRLSVVYANSKQGKTAYYELRAILDNILDERFRILPYVDSALDSDDVLLQMCAPYEPNRTALIMLNDEVVGVIGEFKISVIKQFKLPTVSAGFEISLDSLHARNVSQYVPLSKYPAVSQDLCLEVDASQTFRQVELSMSSAVEALMTDDVSVGLELIDIYEREDASRRRYTFRMKFVSYERTLQEKLVSEKVVAIAEIVHRDIGAVKI